MIDFEVEKALKNSTTFPTAVCKARTSTRPAVIEFYLMDFLKRGDLFRSTNEKSDCIIN